MERKHVRIIIVGVAICVAIVRFSQKIEIKEQLFKKFSVLVPEKELLTDLSAATVVLSLAQKKSKKLYQKYNGSELLQDCLYKMSMAVVPQKVSLNTLQDHCDACYFTKLFEYKKPVELSQTFLDRNISREVIESIQHPQEALLCWVCLESLRFTHPDYFKTLEQEQQSLEALIKMHHILYGYLLTHIILYDVQFGQKEPTKKSYDAFKKLKQYAYTLQISEQNKDLIAEIILCKNLLHRKIKKWEDNATQLLISKKEFRDFHERCACVAAFL